jgi:uncharacterized protein
MVAQSVAPTRLQLMSRFPSRFRRLDDILADLPVDDPPLLAELDGYLTGLAVGPETIPPSEWLPPIWGGGYGETAPFEDPIDVQLFADMVLARYNEILRDLGRGKLQPIFDIDERNGEVLWETWIEGLAMAIGLRPDSWSQDDDVEAAASLAYLHTLMDIVRDDTALTSIEINAICDGAPALIAGHMARLHARHGRQAGTPEDRGDRPAKVGRNDPCPCGSGKKHKRCCGAGF